MDSAISWTLFIFLNNACTDCGEVRVRQLDWLQQSICSDSNGEFSWKEEEIADLYANTNFIVAADVCYDDDLTDGFFKTMRRLCSNFSQPCTILISIEKRMNFTLRHMAVCCEAYNYFQHCMFKLNNLVDGRYIFKVEQIPSNFVQFFLYERTDQLELWKVVTTLLPESCPRCPENRTENTTQVKS